MSLIVDLLKYTSRISSVSFIFPMFAVGIAMLHWRRTAAWGRRWLMAVLLGYWFLAIPLGAWAVSTPLCGSCEPLASRDHARGAQAVVMLGGGTLTYIAGGLAIDDVTGSALRIIEAARVYHLLDDPLLILSGGNTQKLDPPRPEAEAYRDAAIALGVPVSRILVENQSLTTRQQALLLKPILAGRHIDRFVLVTSPTHMKRALGAFRAVGLDPIPSVSRMRSENPNAFSWGVIPDRQSLMISDTSIYDYAAWVYYWSQGWLK